MYPVMFSIPRPERSSRLLLLVRPILFFPHAFWAAGYSLITFFVYLPAVLVALVMGRMPRGLWTFITNFYRYSTLLNAYSMVLSDAYPPFTPSGQEGYPVKIRVEYPERMSRLTILFRWLLMVPHYFFAAFYGFAVMFVFFVAWWAILFLGRWPESLFGIVHRYFVYTSRVNAYGALITDEYPPFNGVQPLSVEEHFENPR